MKQSFWDAMKWFAGLAIVGILVSAGAALADDGLVIDSAEWRAERKILLIEGTAATPDSTVLVRDVKTRALLGAAAVRADGKWLLKIRRPKTVPERMSAECDGDVRECPVSGLIAAR